MPDPIRDRPPTPIERRSRWRRGFAVLLLAAALLAACGDEQTPASQENSAILSGIDSLPKQVVTIVFTPTPSPVMVGVGETVNVAVPTATPGPARATPTLTPYVGVFLGPPNPEGGAPPPTFEPLNIIGAEVASGAVPSVGEASGAATCSLGAAAPFVTSYPGLQARLGCALDAGRIIPGMAAQPFERGLMLWRADTREIYALASGGRYWQTADTWMEGMPADDPAFTAPEGRWQPVRGFGLVWRSDQAIRDALGWGVQSEAQFDATWQDFERGAMFTAADGGVYALFSAEGQSAGPLAR